MIIMVHNKVIVRDSSRISIAGRVRQMKCPYNGFNSAWLISVRLIKRHFMHFIKIAFSHGLRGFIL